jgi:large conductance mechanosensitive channel
MKHFLEEFKRFALRGNVVDLAVAVVVGGAFGKITSSLVDNIVMPLIGILIGGIDLSDLSFSVGGAEVTYGVFLQNVVDFVIIAFAVFVAIKLMSRLQRKQDEAPEEEKPAPPPEDIQLLREIRDALRK